MQYDYRIFVTNVTRRNCEYFYNILSENKSNLILEFAVNFINFFSRYTLLLEQSYVFNFIGITIAAFNYKEADI